MPGAALALEGLSLVDNRVSSQRCDPDHIALRKGKLVSRHNAGPSHQQRAVWKAVLAEEICRQQFGFAFSSASAVSPAKTTAPVRSISIPILIPVPVERESGS